jgi:DnaJ-domain-containing protein 1
MPYLGKIIGALIGYLLLRHPIGLVLGLLVGHAVDAGWFRAGGGAGAARKSEDRYATLGLTADASDAEVEQAYRRLMSQYHPDKVAGAAEEIRQLAEQRAQSINIAYESILRERRIPRE